MMMSSAAAAVSPIDNAVASRKRNRDSDLEFMNEKTKRPRIETDLGSQPDLGFAGDVISGCCGRLGFITKGLGLSDDVIDGLRNGHTRNLLVKQNKLHLVLDLDNTLLNTIYVEQMSPEEEYLKGTGHSDLHFVDCGDQLITKLRPYVGKFIEGASELFELSICTTGSQDYALRMANLLGPANQMFGGRIISRDDHTVNKRKGLDILLARPSAVVILDDKIHVWRNEDQANVIQVQRFGRAYLAAVLKVLRHIHSIFFNPEELNGSELMDRDVRDVLQMAKEGKLKCCKQKCLPSDVQESVAK